MSEFDVLPLVTDPRAISYAVADEGEGEDDAPAPVAAPVAAAGAMVAATIAWKRVDPLSALGVDVRAGTYWLPLCRWPLADDARIDLPEVTITRYAPAKPKPTFRKGPPKGLRALDPLPVAAPVGFPLIHEDFWTWLRPQLAEQDHVGPIAAGHPALARLVATAKAGLASARVNAGANVSADWARLVHDCEHVVRRCGLGDSAAAFSVLRAAHALIVDGDLRAAVCAAATRGLCTSDLRDQVIADVAAAAAAAAREAARVATAKARETELLETDLARSGLCLFTSDHPIFKDQGAPIGSRAIFRTGGLPIGDVTLPVSVPTRAGSVAVMARLTDAETTMLTRAQRDAAAVLPDEIVQSLRHARGIGDRRYTSLDFPGDPRTASGRAALLGFRERASTLIHALANARGHSEHAAYLHHLLMTLGVAFGSEVSIRNQIDSLQQAARDFVWTQSQTRTYGRDGRAGDAVTDAGRPWPSSVPALDSIPRGVLAALAGGSAWKFGECLRPPTPEEARAIRLAVDPHAFEKAVAEAAGDSGELRSQQVYDALHVGGLIASTTPSPAERGRVSAALEALGFERSEVTTSGQRARCWRRREER